MIEFCIQAMAQWLNAADSVGERGGKTFETEGVFIVSYNSRIREHSN